MFVSIVPQTHHPTLTLTSSAVTKSMTNEQDHKSPKRAIKLNNGRAIMLGIIGFMVHRKITVLICNLDFILGAMAFIMS